MHIICLSFHHENLRMPNNHGVYSEVSLLTNVRTNGMTSRLVGKPTAKPIAHPPMNLCRNPGVHPVIIEVIVKVIVESMANVINSAISNTEYFLSNFIIFNHPPSHFSTIKISFPSPVATCNHSRFDAQKISPTAKMQLQDRPFRLIDPRVIENVWEMRKSSTTPSPFRQYLASNYCIWEVVCLCDRCRLQYLCYYTFHSKGFGSVQYAAWQAS